MRVGILKNILFVVLWGSTFSIFAADWQRPESYVFLCFIFGNFVFNLWYVFLVKKYYAPDKTSLMINWAGFEKAEVFFNPNDYWNRKKNGVRYFAYRVSRLAFFTLMFISLAVSMFS